MLDTSLLTLLLPAYISRKLFSYPSEVIIFGASVAYRLIRLSPRFTNTLQPYKMADNSTKFHIYVGTGPLEESKLHIKSAGPTSSGPRLTLGQAQVSRDEKKWMTVMSGAGGIGYCNQSEKHCAGIFTPGQSQCICICIIVAIFDNDHDAWSEA